MKYTFICAIHFLKLEKENNSINLTSGFISNSKQILNEILCNNLSLHTLGLHSIDEIKDAPSFYIVEGDLGENATQRSVDQFGTSLCFCLLRQIQKFIADLWKICDNSIYVRDGFLYTYNKNIADGCTFKASVSAINSFSTGKIENIVIPNVDLSSIGQQMVVFPFDHKSDLQQDYKIATQIQHYKKSGLEKKDIAECYIMMARAQSSIPMKLLLYSAALEALVVTTTTELSHRVAERVAVLLGKTQEERCSIYSDIKAAYDTRSKVAHGDLIRKEEALIIDYSKKVDEYLRQLLQLDSFFSLGDKELDKYFLGKLMH